MQIGPYRLRNNLILAPMAGITDRPFRQLCREFGAGLTVSEMVAANPMLRKNIRTRLKADHDGEMEPHVVQIVGNDPRQMAEAGRYNADLGAQVIDINMGCPAKKVCNKAAGSALLRDEQLVSKILNAVVKSVDLPVTLKMRTGWDPQNRNALQIARIAQDAGISALTIHGRTRACKFSGHAEFETIRQIKQELSIPVVANGDIDSPAKAKFVLQFTGADAIMIGRAAQGRPWIFQEIRYYLNHRRILEKPNNQQLQQILSAHLERLYEYYGWFTGVRMARKHIAWYLNKNLTVSAETLKWIHEASEPQQQMERIDAVFKQSEDGPGK